MNIYRFQFALKIKYDSDLTNPEVVFKLNIINLCFIFLLFFMQL